MPSATEPIGPGKSPRAPRFRTGFALWNRKLHFYAGLFLLFFLWLFAFSGLLLNHPSWSFAESWNNRKETNYEREITPPGPELKGDLGQAREIMRQLGIEGEILWTTTRTDANLQPRKLNRLQRHPSSRPTKKSAPSHWPPLAFLMEVAWLRAGPDPLGHAHLAGRRELGFPGG